MKVKRVVPLMVLLANLAACLTIASCGHESRPPSDRMVSIGSHPLEMHLEGKGSPTVVIDSGITDQMDKLRPLQERIAQVTQVITYNRAAYGQSEPGPLPRHSGREAEHQRQVHPRRRGHALSLFGRPGTRGPKYPVRGFRGACQDRFRISAGAKCSRDASLCLDRPLNGRGGGGEKRGFRPTTGNLPGHPPEAIRRWDHRR